MRTRKKVGLSRRLQKQGLPDPLEEFIPTGKPRNALPVHNLAVQDKVGKKRKRNGIIVTNGKANGGADVMMSGALKSTEESGTPKKKQSTAEIKVKSNGNIKTQNLLAAGSEDERDGSDIMSGLDDSDGMPDEFDISDEDDVEDGALSSGMESYDEFEDSDVVDSDQDMANGIWSDDDSDAAEALNAVNIEGMSRHLDIQAAKDAADAQAELQESAMQTNIAGDQLAMTGVGEDSDEEPGLKTRLAPDLQLLRTRITDIIRILETTSTPSEIGRSRTENIQQLLKDMCAYYSYSRFLAEKLFSLFTPKEAFAFFEANETPRPVVIRTNTLRTHRRELAQRLINRGVTLEPVGKWSKVGLQVFESSVPLGATPEYLAGHYIIQAASSFLPVMALAPQENERILDMASAPGGKTTYMAALMKNTGCIFANDSNKDRAKALIGNIHRLGAKNTVVCNYDAREFPRVMGGFDRVLLDAPCSGTGVISKDASVKTNKTEKDFMRLPHLQKQLLLAAIDSVDHASKSGGYIVYSTCSVTVEENEQVVQYALSRRPNVRIVETGLAFGKEGFVSYMGKKFHPSMKMSRRYYPHAYNVDGFYVCKLKKFGPSATLSGAGSGAKTNGSHSDSLEQAEDKITPVPGSTADVVPDSLIESYDKEDDFGDWDEEEDAAIIVRAKRAALRRKGLNPKILSTKATSGGNSKDARS